MEIIETAAKAICNFEIKGARNTTIGAIKALQMLTQQTTAKDRTQLLNELTQAQQLLFNARETDPLMRNAVNYLISQVQQSRIQKVSKLCDILFVNANNFLRELDASRALAAKIGASLIQDDMTVFTHCNSSIATQMLIKAKQDGKNFKVICTETRPAFLGRVTACELTKNDIETTLIVDSATHVFISKADFVIVGADVITPEGNVINKIGTSGIAVLANEANKPFYIASELLKFDPLTLYSELEGVEQRSPDEVWKDAPKTLNVRNPAFDVTPNKYIHGIICEKGIISPQNVTKTVQHFYPWILK